MVMNVAELQKVLAGLVKQLNWLRSKPGVTPEQLEKVRKHLDKAVQELSVDVSPKE